MIKNRILHLLVLLAGCELVTSCKLNIKSPSPLFTKSLGSKKIVFKPRDDSMELHVGETIMAYCNTEIIYKEYSYNNQHESYRYMGREEEAYINVPIDAAQTTLPINVAEITCNSNNKIGLKNQRSANSNKAEIYCTSSTPYDLYESKKKLPNCEKYMSYAIGVPLKNIVSKIMAGLCYDLDNFDLKFVNYVTQRDAATFGEQKNSNEISLNLDERVGSLKNYHPFMSQRNFNSSRDESQNQLFNAFEFDLTSLLQDTTINNEIEDFDYIFTTMWWRQLRQHNWHHFLTALHDRSQSAKYLIYTGTYGNATMPAAQGNCSSFKSEVVAVNAAGTTVQAPAYIWAYLKPITIADGEKDIVVIAHNSPYVANAGHSDFCNVDVCDEVDWLKNSAFGYLRRLPTLGYTFCCRPEEVAKIIDYFPIEIMETATHRPIENALVKDEK